MAIDNNLKALDQHTSYLVHYAKERNCIESLTEIAHLEDLLKVLKRDLSKQSLYNSFENVVNTYNFNDYHNKIRKHKDSYTTEELRELDDLIYNISTYYVEAIQKFLDKVEERISNDAPQS